LLIPLSMTSSLPTVKAALSGARKTTALAISLGLPKRSAGIWFLTGGRWLNACASRSAVRPLGVGDLEGRPLFR
jgi:hypothetical protein